MQFRVADPLRAAALVLRKKPREKSSALQRAPDVSALGADGHCRHHLLPSTSPGQCRTSRPTQRSPRHRFRCGTLHPTPQTLRPEPRSRVL